MSDNAIAILCRQALALEREAHILGKNVELPITQIIDILKNEHQPIKEGNAP